MTEEQKKFFRRAGVLLERPEHLSGDLHPYCLKASIGDFLGVIEFENLIWIDSDIFLTGDICGPIGQALEALPADKPGVAISRSCGDDSLAEFVERWPVEIFDTLLKHYGVDQRLPYYSVGVVGIRGREFLQVWRDATHGIEEHMCFEQNICNLLLHQGVAHIHELDHRIFNAHNTDLGDLALRRDGNGDLGIFIGDEKSLAIHVSAVKGKFFKVRNVKLKVKGRIWTGVLRLLDEPLLGRYQRALIERFLIENHTGLVETGILKKKGEAVFVAA
jgi:hypothetical protein